MNIDITYTYSIDERKYNEIIRTIAKNKSPNRINADIWAEFTQALENNETPSVGPMNNRAMFIKVVQDTKRKQEKKKKIRNLSKSIHDSENRVVSARKALEEAERELERLKDIACNN